MLGFTLHATVTIMLLECKFIVCDKAFIISGNNHDNLIEGNSVLVFVMCSYLGDANLSGHLVPQLGKLTGLEY